MSQTKPKSWIPEVGEKLVGTLVQYVRATDRNGVTHPVAIVEDGDGTHWSVWIFRGPLSRVFEREKPKPRDRICLRRDDDARRQEPGRKPLGLARPRSDWLITANIAARALWRVRPAVFIPTMRMRFQKTAKQSFSHSAYAPCNVPTTTIRKRPPVKTSGQHLISIVPLTAWRVA